MICKIEKNCHPVHDTPLSLSGRVPHCVRAGLFRATAFAFDHTCGVFSLSLTLTIPHARLPCPSTAMTHTYWTAPAVRPAHTPMGKPPAREGGFLFHVVFA